VGRSGKSGIALKPPLDLRHRDNPQAASADDAQLRLDMALEGRLAHADGLRRLFDGQAEPGWGWAVSHGGLASWLDGGARLTCPEKVGFPRP
jgi:hypothetical protein